MKRHAEASYIIKDVITVMAVEKRGELSLSKKVIKKATFDDLQISFYKKQTYTGQTAIFSGLELEDE